MSLYSPSLTDTQTLYVLMRGGKDDLFKKDFHSAVKVHKLLGG